MTTTPIQPPTLVWGASNWLTFTAIVAALFIALLVWGYWRTGSSAAGRGIRLLAASLKAIGVLILALCLLEPLFSGTRAKPGANQFVVLADNSQSMNLRDRDSTVTRGQELQSIAPKTAKWLERLAQDFDLHEYDFDTQLRAVGAVGELPFDGAASNLGESLDRLARRYQGRPLAGIILLTDGNATDADAVQRVLARSAAAIGTGDANHTTAAAHLPPIYPILLGRSNPADDVNLARIGVSQTNFEDAPVTLTAQITTSGFRGRTLVATLLDENGHQIEQQKIKVDQPEDQPLVVRFRLRPEQPGVSFYRVAVAPEGYQPPSEQSAPTGPSTLPVPEARADIGGEATLANNTRLVAVDRGEGPYRVLYVSGRPNWEYKFLNRAIQADTQVQLVGLIRVAKREPKFNYLGHQGEQANPLFRGFNNTDQESVEQYDQPVLVRLNTQDELELRGGFPKAAEDLYKYSAIILDDVESGFFTQDQMLLIKEFVRQRGGGLLMLGGEESFKNGKYDKTPIGDLLPVYLDDVSPVAPDVRVRMSLTREGWLEPWVRLRSEEDAERQRLDQMPAFDTINAIRGIKPGATILARAEIENTAGSVPALVEQRFGRGRTAALLIGDLWRWDLRRPSNTQSDLEKAWRQTVRWLVAEVPQRLEVSLDGPKQPDDPEGTMRLDVRVRDPKFMPLDNASVAMKVTGPDGKSVDLTAEPSDREAGLYEAVYVPREPGAYRVAASVAAPDGSDVGQVASGWTTDPAADEFRDLKPNRPLLEDLAKRTGGEEVKAADLDSFVATLPTRHAEVTEPYIRPMWHQAWVFLLAILCLSAEWGIRRWQGMP